MVAPSIDIYWVVRRKGSNLEKQLVCVGCPMGCRLTVEIEDGEATSVAGHGCKRGAEYARQEAVMPLRVLTGNMKAQGCARPFSVRTDRPVPKELLLACAQELKRHRPALPIAMGDIVIENLLGTGSRVIATQDLTAQALDTQWKGSSTHA